MTLISEQYDKIVGYALSGLCPVFIPIEADGRNRVYQAIISPTPEQREDIKERHNQWLLAAVDAVRRMALEDGYEPKE